MSLLGRGLGRLLREGDICPGWGGGEYFSNQRGKGIGRMVQTKARG